MPQKIKEGIFQVGVNDWDRRLFDELIPLPEGTSYNAYLIKGRGKTALIDTVDPPKKEELIARLKRLNITKLDFLIAQHAEQDHAGALPDILALYPMAKLVTNSKCKSFLMDLLLISEERFLVVNDEDEISLGDKTLKFIFTPWVHWPETMCTYLKEDKILFTCDFFGSHYATSELFADETEIYKPAKRYYAEIMMPFRKNIKKNLQKIEGFDIAIIAPSHGPLYDKPEFILNAYKDWISDKVKNEVIIPYVSMHGSTERMVYFFIDCLMERNIVVKPFNLTKTNVGEMAMALVDAATIVLASPMVLAGPHPAVMYAAYLANVLRPKAKFASFIGSYGWGGRLVEKITEILSNFQGEFLEPVLVKGYPKGGDFKEIEKLADEILAKHKSIGII
ncbi:MAG: FprA family A-type flavoprotein [Candidatus Desulfofervidaceae bacterium]|nr:FprA family A-type flavoprotein [Candidatus Desulfofervidaceae bacterium]